VSDEYGRPPAPGEKTGPREVAKVLGQTGGTVQGGNTSVAHPKP
jgi:hypothetical protein